MRLDVDVDGDSDGVCDRGPQGLLTLHGASPASFYTPGPSLRVPAAADRGELGPDRGELAADRWEFGPDRWEIPDDLQRDLATLGTRPRVAQIRPLIVRLCELGAWRPAKLAEILGFKRSELLVARHLKTMCEEGLLERTFPETPNHPEQAYQAALNEAAARQLGRPSRRRQRSRRS